MKFPTFIILWTYSCHCGLNASKTKASGVMVVVSKSEDAAKTLPERPRGGTAFAGKRYIYDYGEQYTGGSQRNGRVRHQGLNGVLRTGQGAVATRTEIPQATDPTTSS